MRISVKIPLFLFGATVFLGACAPTGKHSDVASRGLLKYVDTRVGTAASIADITVTEVEEPMGYVSPIVGDSSALTHWTPQTAIWTDRVATVPVPYWYDQEKIQGIKEMKANEKLAPDANRSLRVSFGKVKGIKDGELDFSYASTLDDLVQKNAENARIYEAPSDFIESCKAEIKAGKKALPTCFITDCHTTGGNSGSPVLNAKGKLIGLNFDSAGNGLVSSFKFMPELTRQISVDIRYVRFVLEHQLKAYPLLEEWQ
jgi:hypothetical protein